MIRFSINKMIWINLTNKNYNKSIVNTLIIRFIGNQSPKVTPILPKDLNLRHCPRNIAKYNSKEVRRPLTIIMAWMLAEDKHIEIYRQLWLKRGFDVLTVKTSPLDLLIPPIGAQVVANNLLKYLLQLCPQLYEEIIVHSFSVGGYQFGELHKSLLLRDEYKDLSKSFKGVIMDSLVHVDYGPSGLSRAITNNPILQSLLEMSLKVYLGLTRRITIEEYRKCSDLFIKNPLRLPGLFLFSKDDVVSDFSSTEKVVEIWRQSGVVVKSKCWLQSKHVMHYRQHQLEYEKELDYFLVKLNL